MAILPHENQGLAVIGQGRVVPISREFTLFYMVGRPEFLGCGKVWIP
jgi:hypothetical protein